MYPNYLNSTDSVLDNVSKKVAGGIKKTFMNMSRAIGRAFSVWDLTISRVCRRSWNEESL